MSDKTNKQYHRQVEAARKIFIDKNKDYGTSWRILRLSTFIDQIYIKAFRIRSIEEGQVPRIQDDVVTEYRGIINYCALALIQIDYMDENPSESEFEQVLKKYDEKIKTAFELMLDKNHDYGEAWRNMYVSSFTDIILARILRMKQILDNQGITMVSEGIDANLYDMINYSFFALIRLNEQYEKQ